MANKYEFFGRVRAAHYDASKFGRHDLRAKLDDAQRLYTGRQELAAIEALREVEAEIETNSQTRVDVGTPNK